MTTYKLDDTTLYRFKHLEEKAFAKIGTMNEGSYEEFSEKMHKVAKEAGIVNPQMAIGILFKVQEKINIVDSQKRWSMLKESIEEMRPPHPYPIVYVIDGSKFKVLSI